MAEKDLISEIEQIETEARAYVENANEAARELLEETRKQSELLIKSKMESLQQLRQDLRRKNEKEQNLSMQEELTAFKAELQKKAESWKSHLEETAQELMERSVQTRGNR